MKEGEGREKKEEDLDDGAEDGVLLHEIVHAMNGIAQAGRERVDGLPHGSLGKRS